MIKIRRISAFVDWLRGYQIILDGEVVGKIKNGGEIELDITPGRHNMQLKIDWCDSNPVEFEFQDRPLLFECGSHYRGWRLFRGVGHIMAPSGHYLWLKQLTDADTAPAGAND